MDDPSPRFIFLRLLVLRLVLCALYRALCIARLVLRFGSLVYIAKLSRFFALNEPLQDYRVHWTARFGKQARMRTNLDSDLLRSVYITIIPGASGAAE